MADNTQLPIGTLDGDIYGSDDIGGVKYQRVKLIKGADGVNDGDISDTNGIPVKSQIATTATLANVAQIATSVTLLAANTARMGAVFVNDSTSILYMKYGASASITSYTYKMDPYDTVEINANMLYTGLVSGIWAAAGSGNARVTEV